MCMVSVIAGYGQQRISQQQWTPDTFQQFKEILERLKVLDDKLGQADCESTEKTAWMEAIERRLAALETP